MKLSDIIAFDLGRNLGIWDGKKAYTKHLTAKEHDELFLDATEFFYELLQVHRNKVVVYEEIMFTKFTKAAQIGFGLRAILLNAAKRLNMQIYGYAPTTIKKEIAGGGRANKQDVFDSVKKYSPDSFDSADAVAAALTHIKKLEV